MRGKQNFPTLMAKVVASRSVLAPIMCIISFPANLDL